MEKEEEKNGPAICDRSDFVAFHRVLILRFPIALIVHVAWTWYFPQNEDPTSFVLLDSQRNSAFSITPASLNARISIYHCLFDTWIQMYHRESGPRGSQTVLRPLSIVQARLGQGGRL